MEDFASQMPYFFIMCGFMKRSSISFISVQSIHGITANIIIHISNQADWIPCGDPGATGDL